jgi:hypothetical protein
LIRDGGDLPFSEFRTNNGFIGKRAFRQARADGYTVLLNSLQRRHQEIAEICRCLEAEFLAQGVPLSHPITANAYATPSAARGFKPHYDDHEVLVLQLEGRKKWRVFEQIKPQPIARMTGVVAEEHFGAPISEIWMEPGDVLYIPRGYPHDAAAIELPTLHLTLAIHVHSWLDLAIAAIHKSPLFRASLPQVRGGSKQQQIKWSEGLSARLRQHAASTAEMPGVAAELLDAFMLSIESALSARQADASAETAITQQSLVGKCQGSFFLVDIRDREAALLYPSGIYEGPPEFASVFRYIASHETFAVGDLPDVSSDIKLRIVGHLLSEGCLVRSPR